MPAGRARREHTWLAIIVNHAGVDGKAEQCEGPLPFDVVPWKALSAEQKERWWPEALGLLERLETEHKLIRFDNNPGNFAVRLRREGGGGGSEEGSVVLLDMKTLSTLEQHARNLFHPRVFPRPAARAGCTTREAFQATFGPEDLLFDDEVVVDIALQAGVETMEPNFNPTTAGNHHPS